jgi:hypothetical protein
MPFRRVSMDPPVHILHNEIRVVQMRRKDQGHVVQITMVQYPLQARTCAAVSVPLPRGPAFVQQFTQSAMLVTGGLANGPQFALPY